MGKRGITILVAIVMLLAIAVAMTMYLHGIRWRLEVISMKAGGALTDISWSQLLHMIEPASGYYLEPLTKEKNLYRVIRNPFSSKKDIESGEKSYRAQCAVCHGVDGVGGSASSLADGQYSVGDTDWALYLAITRGIPGTAMEGRDMEMTAVWQIVTYIRSIAREHQSGVTASGSGQVGTISKEMFPASVTYERIKNADQEPRNWLTYGGGYSSWRHSNLDQLTTVNVRQLKVLWTLQMPTNERHIQTTPLVVDGVMYVTEPPNNVHAIDAYTGELLWSYERNLPSEMPLCCGRVNRGLAMLGDKVYLATLDAHLVALNHATGKVEWDVQLADYNKGYSITAAPLAIDGKVICGIAGGEFGTRGFLDAFDAHTGKRLWRFNTIPGPGEPGHDTWTGDSWKTGGAPTWVTGSYDADLNIVYWGVGNPGPDFQGDVREGDNLYSNSVVAVDVDTGQLKWFFQFTPHDEHDWDANHTPILVDAEFDGAPRKLLLMATKNGFLYVLDRETGKFLLGRPFVKQTWADGLTPEGRPIVKDASSPSEKGTLTYPSVTGGTNWWPSAYNPQTGLWYIPVLERGSIFFKTEVKFEEGKPYMGSAYQPLPDEDHYTAIRAYLPSTGELVWEHSLPPRRLWGAIGGVLSTEGDLVFFGDYHTFYALDARDGQELWKFNLGGNVIAPPVSYLAGQRQQITIAAGRTLFTFGLDK